ncbi:MAG: ion transporter [Parcubacteria group bacterium]|nr:ion transporter [Parcubacteria group bacterium]
MAENASLNRSVRKDVLMALLAMGSIFLLVIEVIVGLPEEEVRFIHYIDIGIAFVFLAEFIYHFFTATHRSHFLKTRWWELLAAIPLTTNTTQALRGLRVVRAFRVFEGVRAVRFLTRLKVLTDLSERYTRQVYLMYIATTIGFIILSGALAFHYFEAPVNPHVKTFFDSFWWATITVATVGYGDVYPTTVGGRVVAIYLMLGGVGMLATFITVINDYVIGTMTIFRPRKEEDQK